MDGRRADAWLYQELRSAVLKLTCVRRQEFQACAYKYLNEMRFSGEAGEQSVFHLERSQHHRVRPEIDAQ